MKINTYKHNFIETEKTYFKITKSRLKTISYSELISIISPEHQKQGTQTKAKISEKSFFIYGMEQKRIETSPWSSTLSLRQGKRKRRDQERLEEKQK